MEKKLTKYFWIIILVTLVIVAFFMALGTNELVAGTVAKLMPSTSSVVNQNINTVNNHRSNINIVPNGDIILSRNIFDSAAGALEELDDIDPEEEPVSLDGDLPVVQCDIPGLKLLAMVSSGRDVEWSFVNMEVDGQKQLFRMGDQIKDRTISDVGWRYLMLRGSRDECYIDMFDQNPKKSKKPKLNRGNKNAKDEGEGIAVTGEFERTVDRAVVDQALANPTKFAKSVRVRPYKKNGKVVGFRLRRVQRGSAIEKLGAKRGDILHSVNGVELKSVDDALTAYQKLRSDNKLIFNITRKGKPVELKINIQ